MPLSPAPQCCTRLIQRLRQQTRQAIDRIPHSCIDYVCRQRNILRPLRAHVESSYRVRGAEKNAFGLIPADMKPEGLADMAAQICRKCVACRPIYRIARMQTPRADEFAAIQHTDLRIGRADNQNCGRFTVGRPIGTRRMRDDLLDKPHLGEPRLERGVRKGLAFIVGELGRNSHSQIRPHD